MTATARRTDPDTSRDAAQAHEASGTASSNRDRVRIALAAYPGRTAPEYGQLTGLGHVEAQRRLSDLKGRRECHTDGVAECKGHRGRLSMWWPGERKAELKQRSFLDG